VENKVTTKKLMPRWVLSQNWIKKNKKFQKKENPFIWALFATKQKIIISL